MSEYGAGPRGVSAPSPGGDAEAARLPPFRRRPNRSLAAEVVRHTVRRFRAGWAEQPPAAVRRWLATLGVGLVVSWAVMLALNAAGMWMERAGRLAWEADWLRRFASTGPLTFAQSLWAEAPGGSVVLIPLVVTVAVACTWRGLPLRALALLAAFFLLDAVVLLGWWTWDRPRPDVIAGGIAAPGFKSFPSGHASQTLATYGFLAWLWIRATPHRVERVLVALGAVALTALVSAARLRLGVHWPSDIAAGVVVGGLWLAVVIVALRRAEAAGGR